MTRDSSMPGGDAHADVGASSPPSTTVGRTGPSAGSIGRFILALLPFIGMLVMIPWVNRTDPFVLGLPFLLFWVVIWVVLTSLCMTVVYFTDPANKPGSGR